jgi:hypothetical protein
MAAFLIDASLPRATGDVIRAHGHRATDVRDIGLGTASDREIADHAYQFQFTLVRLPLARVLCDQATRPKYSSNARMSAITGSSLVPARS